MERESKADKIKAIYALRSAAEEKARAEHELQGDPTAEHRDALLDAQMALEAKTQDAIEVCHDCGSSHKPDQPHARVTARNQNVVDVDFRGQGDPKT